MQQGCYWDFLRVVAPSGARLQSVLGVIDGKAETEGDRTVLSGYFVVPRGETRRVRLTYSVPSVAREGSTYVLHLARQSGAPVIPATVRVSWPVEWQFMSSSVAPVAQAGSSIEFAAQLDRDQDIRLALSKTAGLGLVNAR